MCWHGAAHGFCPHLHSADFQLTDRLAGNTIHDREAPIARCSQLCSLRPRSRRLQHRRTSKSPAGPFISRRQPLQTLPSSYVPHQPPSASLVRRVLPPCLRTDPPLAHQTSRPTQSRVRSRRRPTPAEHRKLRRDLVDAGTLHRQSCIVVPRAYSPGVPARTRTCPRPPVTPSDHLQCP